MQLRHSSAFRAFLTTWAILLGLGFFMWAEALDRPYVAAANTRSPAFPPFPAPTHGPGFKTERVRLLPRSGGQSASPAGRGTVSAMSMTFRNSFVVGFTNVKLDFF
ncbi:hypothetical protein C8F04DRAFT_1111960 [Mycena alexandri]|uniref:Uncharacterized protein n=1 Tax=Mycena alexandri TaxID=1745969 RepID=A0AAD6X144_9AGAR|nr:hypothetical protein C8F04DRAFT_1111960 [Mycena alexandri]